MAWRSGTAIKGKVPHGTQRGSVSTRNGIALHARAYRRSPRRASRAMPALDGISCVGSPIGRGACLRDRLVGVRIPPGVPERTRALPATQGAVICDRWPPRRPTKQRAPGNVRREDSLDAPWAVLLLAAVPDLGATTKAGAARDPGRSYARSCATRLCLAQRRQRVVLV